jgi:hypothetical protein
MEMHDMNRVALLGLGILLANLGLAGAQNLTRPGDSAPVVHGAGGLPAPVQPPVLSGTPITAAKLHLGPTGKPCIRMEGYAKPQTINPNIFNHLILATNSCALRIKMQVCYYNTQHCIPVELGAYERKEAALGIFPALKEFRFEYKEQF